MDDTADAAAELRGDGDSDRLSTVENEAKTAAATMNNQSKTSWPVTSR